MANKNLKRVTLAIMGIIILIKNPNKIALQTYQDSWHMRRVAGIVITGHQSRALRHRSCAAPYQWGKTRRPHRNEHILTGKCR